MRGATKPSPWPAAVAPMREGDRACTPSIERGKREGWRWWGGGGGAGKGTRLDPFVLGLTAG